MKISVVTVCFNNESTIRDTMLSVCSQKDVDFEHVIIDGGSTDNTLNIIRDFNSENSRVISEPDKGIYDAMNKGIRMTRGDIVGFLHADDFFSHAHVLHHIHEAFQQDVLLDACYGDLIYVNAESPDKIIRRWKSGKYKEGAFLWGWMPPHPTFYMKRKLYEEKGNYNTQFTISSDYELMLRYIHKEKIKLHYLTEVLVNMRVGGKSNASIGNRLVANREDRKAWVVNGIVPYPFTLFLKPLRKLSQFIG